MMKRKLLKMFKRKQLCLNNFGTTERQELYLYLEEYLLDINIDKNAVVNVCVEVCSV